MAVVGIIPPAQTQWDPFDRKYKCCCNNCHVTTGTKIIGILAAVGCGLDVVNIITSVGRFGLHSYMYGQVLAVVIIVTALVFLFLGLKHERPSYLLPYMVLQVIGIIFVFVAIILCIVAAALGAAFLEKFMQINLENQTDGENMEEYAESATKIVLIVCAVVAVVLALVAALYIWFFLIVLRCYRFFQYKQRYGNTAASGIALPTVTTYNYGPPAFNTGYGPPTGYVQPVQQMGYAPANGGYAPPPAYGQAAASSMYPNQQGEMPPVYAEKQ